jgi:endonuclease IV
MIILYIILNMIGMHIGKTSKLTNKTFKTMLEVIEADNEVLGMSAISLFMHGPQNTRKNKMAYDSIKEYCEKNNIVIFPHGSYVSVGVWNVNTDNIDDEKSIKFIQHIQDSLTSGHEIGAKGVVVHVPRHPIETVVNVMEILSKNENFIEARANNKLATMTLEMPASRPNPTLTYETPKKLNAFCKALNDNKHINIDWNICLDTCHLYAGAVDFSEPDSWDNYEKNLTALVISKIKLIHLNGAKLKNLGTGKDGHMIP